MPNGYQKLSCGNCSGYSPYCDCIDCPHCGKGVKKYEFEAERGYEEDGCEIHCPHCNQAIRYSISCTTSVNVEGYDE